MCSRLRGQGQGQSETEALVPRRSCALPCTAEQLGGLAAQIYGRPSPELSRLGRWGCKLIVSSNLVKGHMPIDTLSGSGSASSLIFELRHTETTKHVSKLKHLEFTTRPCSAAWENCISVCDRSVGTLLKMLKLGRGHGAPLADSRRFQLKHWPEEAKHQAESSNKPRSAGN